MKNEYMRPASELSLPVPAGTRVGSPVKVGALVGVAATDRGAGGNIATHASVLLDDRAYTLDVDGAIAGVGTQIFITDGNTLTTTAPAAGGAVFGHSICKADGTFAAKGAGVGPAIVKLAKV